MDRNRVYRIFILVALLLAVAGVTIGFASYSTSLQVSSSTGTIPAQTDPFPTAVVFSSVTSGTISADGKTWSGAVIELDNDTLSVTATGTISNSSNYNAHLTGLTSNESVSCSAAAASSLESDEISSFCSGLTVTYSFNSNVIKTITGASAFGTASLTDTDYYVPKNNTSTLEITVSYSGSTFPSGDIAITVPSITTTFTSGSN